MLKDRYDNQLTTSSTAARDAYVKGVDIFLSANSGADLAFAEATAADGHFCLAHLGLARAKQTLAQAAQAKEALAAARATSKSITNRESGQLNVLGLLIEGQGPAAYQAARAHLVEHPADAMAAQTCTGVFGLIGFSGQPGREAEHLALTTYLAPHYGDDWWFLTQHAFAQMEVGQLGPAAGTIEKALNGNPRNANAAHYRAHLYYENSETSAGFAYLDTWMKDYHKPVHLHCHLSWHLALWALAKGDIDSMWRIVDADVAPNGALGPALNILSDMTALLYRAELAGVDVPPERWQVMSGFATQYFPNTGVAFADVHAALAHAMAGDSEALTKIIVDGKGPAVEIVTALAEGFQAIAAAQWTEAAAHLAKAMTDHARIGGSRAQRDLVEYAMTSVLLKLGKADEARRLLQMRRPLTWSTDAVQGL